MIDAFVDKMTRTLCEEKHKKIKQICAEKPEIVQNRERVVLWEQDKFLDGQTTKRYWFTLDGEEIACFYVGLDRDTNGHLQIKASDVVYPQN